MPATTGPWPIRLKSHPARLASALLALCLLSPGAIAQEPEANTEAPAASNAISSMSKSSEAPLYPSRDIRNKSLIAAVMDDEAQWLETEHGKILALYRPTEAKKTLGVLILFHAAENPQLWPPTLENLRAKLPRYGWETLAISLPQLYPAAVPARPGPASASASASSAAAATETTTETPTEEAVAASSSSLAPSSSSAASSSVARELLIAAYVDAAFNFLKQKGQLNTVVLADNSSVFQIMQALGPQIKDNSNDTTVVDGPLQALIITNLQPQEPISKQELESIFGAQQLPVQDLFFAPVDAGQMQARELHRAVAMRKKVADYLQLLIDDQPKSVEQDHQSFVLGRVRGFMQQKAKGTELKSPSDATRP